VARLTCSCSIRSSSPTTGYVAGGSGELTGDEPGERANTALVDFDAVGNVL
jgi:hypothetical protein